MRFQPLADFSAGEPGYRILPLRFMRWSADEVFVTNDAGEFLFIGRDAFAAFADHRLPHARPGIPARSRPPPSCRQRFLRCDRAARDQGAHKRDFLRGFAPAPFRRDAALRPFVSLLSGVTGHAGSHAFRHEPRDRGARST